MPCGYGDSIIAGDRCQAIGDIGETFNGYSEAADREATSGRAVALCKLAGEGDIAHGGFAQALAMLNRLWKRSEGYSSLAPQ